MTSSVSVHPAPTTTTNATSRPATRQSEDGDASGEERRLYDPVPLTPTQPIIPAQRIHRHVRNLKLSADAADDCHDLELPECRSLVALQPISPRPSSSPPGPSGYEVPAAYVFDEVLTENPKTGVTMLVAHPMMPEDPANSATCCLVSCGTSPVVIKAVPRPSVAPSRRHVADDPLMEIAAMELLMSHAHTDKGGRSSRVIQLLDCLQDEDYIYLVLPYMSHGDLFSLLENLDGSGGLPESQACRYVRQIAEGLLFMKRSCNMAHRDVSLENVTLTAEDDVCIIDLGTSLVVPKRDGDDTQKGPVLLKRRRCCGKSSYIPPEVVRQEPLDVFAADIWSLGVCFYTLLCGRPLYNSSNDQAFAILSKGGVADVIDIYEGYGMKLPSASAVDLVCRMLHADPAKRPTLEEVLMHPYLRRMAGDNKRSTASSVGAGMMMSHAINTLRLKQRSCSYQGPCPWGLVVRNNAHHLLHDSLAVQ